MDDGVIQLPAEEQLARTRLARLHRNLHGVSLGVVVVAAVCAAGQLKMAREQAEDAR